MSAQQQINEIDHTHSLGGAMHHVTFTEARKRAARWIADARERGEPVSSVDMRCIRGDDSIEVVRFGPQGGHRTVKVERPSPLG